MAQAVQRLAAKVPELMGKTAQAVMPRMNTFVRYAKVELVPPSPAEFPAVQKGFQDLVAGFRAGKWKQLTVKDATVNAVVAVEVLCWFTIGECIGKGSLIGYQIPGATHMEGGF